MYSNDMWEFHPERPEFWSQWPLQFWENDKVTIERVTPKEQKMLTTWYTEHAIDFINRNKQNPFFLYVPHSMPHVPLFCSEKFEGKSGKGLYADVMMEIDWSVGKIVEALQINGLDKNTVVIFTSDNGPWTSYGNHAGKTPYREAKATGFDGGIRSALIIKYPGMIKANTVSDKAFFSIDILPTVCHLAGAKLPANTIDGKNVWDLISNKPGANNPHDYYAFSTGKNFEGVLSGDGNWKLHIPHQYRTLVYPGMDGQAGKYKQAQVELSLFDMKNDPYERVNVIDKYPQLAAELQQLAEQHKDRFYTNSEN
jgi:arylsulfatase A-like enzyme